MKATIVKMRLITRLLIIALITGNLTSCEEYGGIDSQMTSTPKLESDALAQYDVLATDPADIVFNVSGNTPWHISVATESDEQSWCVATPAMSSAAGLVSEVVVSMTTNPDKKERAATLTLTAENVNETITIQIIQEAQGNLHVEGTALSEEFDTNGEQSKQLIIRSNKAWEIISEDPWIQFSAIEGEAGEQATTVNVTVTPNEGLKREATFIVKTAMQEIERTIRQKGITLEIDEAGLEMLSALPAQPAEVIEIEVNASGEWTPETTASWISGIEKTGNKLTFVIEPNYNFAPREEVILLKGSSIELEVPVRQLGATFHAWEKGTQNPVELPAERITEKGILLKVSDGIRLAFPEIYKRGTFTWEFEQISTQSPLILEGAANYSAATVPNAHLVFSDPQQTFNGPNDFRINNGAGNGWWLTWQQVGVLRNQSASIKKVVLTFGTGEISLRIYDGAETLLAEKIFTTDTSDARWIGTDGFGYSLYFSQQLETEDYCILKSFRAEPAE